MSFCCLSVLHIKSAVAHTNVLFELGRVGNISKHFGHENRDVAGCRQYIAVSRNLFPLHTCRRKKRTRRRSKSCLPAHCPHLWASDPTFLLVHQTNGPDDTHPCVLDMLVMDQGGLGVVR